MLTFHPPFSRTPTDLFTDYQQAHEVGGRQVTQK